MSTLHTAQRNPGNVAAVVLVDPLLPRANRIAGREGLINVMTYNALTERQILLSQVVKEDEKVCVCGGGGWAAQLLACICVSAPLYVCASAPACLCVCMGPCMCARPVVGPSVLQSLV